MKVSSVALAFRTILAESGGKLLENLLSAIALDSDSHFSAVTAGIDHMLYTCGVSWPVIDDILTSYWAHQPAC